MTQGILTKPVTAWVKTAPYILEKGVLIKAEWSNELQWWNISFKPGHKHATWITATTTDDLEVK